MTPVEGGQQRVIVDERSTTGIDDERAFGQQRQRFGVQGIFSGGCAGQQQDQDLRLP